MLISCIIWNDDDDDDNNNNNNKLFNCQFSVCSNNKVNLSLCLRKYHATTTDAGTEV